MTLHVQTELRPQNIGTVTTHDQQQLTIDPSGSVWVNGQKSEAQAVQLVRLSDGQVYVKGMRSGVWYRYSGDRTQVDWVLPGTDATSVLALL